MDGALALVTGAGSGIGRATAELLARRGARVLVLDVDGDAGRATAEACGGVAYQADVADQGALTELAATVESRHGPLDVLVNNAGVGLSGRFLDTTKDDWDWILGVNLLGAVHGCRAFGPAMVARGGGHVVNVSSALGYFPRATEPAYVTTKAGVLALSRCLRADWARAGVGVSAVCPGVVATSIIDHARFRGERARPETVQRVRDTFRRHGLAPARVAAAIVGAVARNRAVVPVGVDAWVGWLLAGLVPARAGDRLAVLGRV
ncbi:MAG TPA: SDR family NAD(P)-dependent oxidoreductase [Acidimicrobiales bacterium]|nr:SDR family NAD(P)-dependent oxidoreductase [Acidimicrobiales bacterium]